jgi:hypothetical protein
MPLPTMEKAFAELSVNTDKRRNKELAAFIIEFEYVSEKTRKKGSVVCFCITKRRMEDKMNRQERWI